MGTMSVLYSGELLESLKVKAMEWKLGYSRVVLMVILMDKLMECLSVHWRVELLVILKVKVMEWKLGCSKVVLMEISKEMKRVVSKEIKMVCLMDQMLEVLKASFKQNNKCEQAVDKSV